MLPNRTNNRESTSNQPAFFETRLATVGACFRGAARWTPWLAIVAYASLCAYWKPPALDQSWWLVFVALWAVPSGSLSRIEVGRIPLVIGASCPLVFAWAFYRMQTAVMDSMYTWRFAQDLHCYDPVSRSIRISIAGTATALALAIPLYRIAGRALLPMAALAVVPFVVLVERHWLDQPVSIVIQLLITLIPPCLFLTVCFFLEKTSAKRSEWWGRNSRVMRWGLRNVHGSVVWLFYAVLLFLIIGTFHLEFHRGYDLWSAAPAGGGFIIVMFAFGRVTVETWQSCARKENGGTLGRVVARLGKGSVAMSCIVALVLSLFEAPIAAQAIAGTIEHVGTSPWEVRVDGTVLFLRGLFRPGIADATEDALRKNVGLKVVDLDSVGGEHCRGPGDRARCSKIQTGDTGKSTLWERLHRCFCCRAGTPPLTPRAIGVPFLSSIFLVS